MKTNQRLDVENQCEKLTNGTKAVCVNPQLIIPEIPQKIKYFNEPNSHVEVFFRILVDEKIELVLTIKREHRRKQVD